MIHNSNISQIVSEIKQLPYRIPAKITKRNHVHFEMKDGVAPDGIRTTVSGTIRNSEDKVLIAYEGQTIYRIRKFLDSKNIPYTVLGDLYLKIDKIFFDFGNINEIKQLNGKVYDLTKLGQIQVKILKVGDYIKKNTLLPDVDGYPLGIWKVERILRTDQVRIRLISNEIQTGFGIELYPINSVIDNDLYFVNESLTKFLGFK